MYDFALGLLGVGSALLLLAIYTAARHRALEDLTITALFLAIGLMVVSGAVGLS